jgi:hypothetical protein
MFEGRGISDIIKSYYIYLYNNYINGEYEYQVDLDQYQELPLINFKISIKNSTNNCGIHIPGKLIKNDNNYFIDGSILFINFNDITELKGLLIHELTHIKEYYEIMKKIDILNIEITPTYFKIRNVYNDIKNLNKEYYDNFLYLIYLSLSTEMNSRVAQVYDYLYNLKIKDEDQLFNELKKHKNYNFLELLNNFDSNIFINNMIEYVGLESFIEISQRFIDKLNIEFNKPIKPIKQDKKFPIEQKIKDKVFFKFLNKKINNIEDLKYIYKNFEKYFKLKCEKHIEHFKYLIKEVIEDLNEKSTFHSYSRMERYDNNI